ncbi:MAG: sugar phosphate isomerase/epimerase [Candidatus Sumerlaeota bacterium]|nr:sugar phosphate isomerase/epimerase [Candidatus Sumerlaeota bacterium]
MWNDLMQLADKQTRRRFVAAAGAFTATLAAGTPGEAAESEAPQAQPARAPKAPFDLALASFTLRNFPLDEALAMTRRVGLEFICFKSMHLPLDATPEQIAAAVAKVKDAGLVLYGAGVVGMKNDAQAAQAFDYAKAAGMRTIIASPDPALLPLLNEKVQQYDIQVAIHNHGPGDKKFPTPQTVYEKVKELDPRIGLCMDIGHTTRAGADPVRDAERYADRLLDLHIKDVSEAAANGKTVEMGRGVIDLPAFFRVLLKIQYKGKAAFEYEKDASDPLPGLSESVGYVKGVLAAL